MSSDGEDDQPQRGANSDARDDIQASAVWGADRFWRFVLPLLLLLAVASTGFVFTALGIAIRFA